MVVDNVHILLDLKNGLIDLDFYASMPKDSHMQLREFYDIDTQYA